MVLSKCVITLVFTLADNRMINYFQYVYIHIFNLMPDRKPGNCTNSNNRIIHEFGKTRRFPLGLKNLPEICL